MKYMTISNEPLFAVMYKTLWLLVLDTIKTINRHINFEFSVY